MSIRNRAWTALIMPPVTWFLFEQGLSALLHADCQRSGIGIAWGMASLAVCGFAARLAWRSRAAGGQLADPWLARLALAVAGIFALAISFQTLAILIVPACVG
ncbi:hypothetical protein [Sphingomonas jatrophae]|uniref:Uncharacterized protein n=1 Tax=Sphingomonas jatrophae TaxID=1166337 RepID=A0A1I6JA28_9SPHN|nr:hypothetical protein [Sphingomonas jatrophae]SFR75819.1 hypothetical protein SAMN05192580_0018 [Sphingomonas jatrophae]